MDYCVLSPKTLVFNWIPLYLVIPDGLDGGGVLARREVNDVQLDRLLFGAGAVDAAGDADRVAVAIAGALPGEGDRTDLRGVMERLSINTVPV